MSATNTTVLRTRLGAELRALRERTGQSLTTASRALADRDHDISASKLNRLENGKGSIKLQDIRALLDLYGVTDTAQVELLSQMAREAKAAVHARAWWTDYEAVLPSKFQTYIELESAASNLMTFTLTLIDGLLQTQGYARALYEASCPSELPDGVDQLVGLRLRRQTILHDDPAVALTTIMDETALRRPIGPAPTMRAQLDHLVAVANDLPHVTIQVIPLSAGPHGTLNGHFSIIEPYDPQDQTHVYVDSPGGNMYLQRPDQIQRFQTRFDRLQALAHSPAESQRLIRTAAKEI